MRVDSSACNLASVLRECFSSDPALCEKWHIAAPGSVDDCVSRTLADVEETFDVESFQFYRAYVDEVLVGYWGTEFGKYLNLIFVKPQFRSREFLKDFWSEVKATVSRPFYTAVYSKNVPAVRFYSRQGQKLSEQPVGGHPATIFEFRE